MQKKRFFTLIEVILSLTLIALLLSTLLFWYNHLLSLRTERETQQMISLQTHLLHQRLKRILPKATATHFFTTSTDETLLNGQSLIFTFDNGPQSEPRLSDEVLGRLYLNTHTKTLCLGIWPIPEHGKDPHLTLSLLDHVEHLAFEFYFPPDPFRLIVSPDKVGEKVPKIGWQKNWDSGYCMLPALIKMVVTKVDGTIEIFPYDIRSANLPIVYQTLEAG
ncbi:MAG: DUF1494 domain-containing protein [Chlamydiia bacterium]|nr:DUF1494 domain-containing protein [Chlamydiia bacterium]